MACKQTETLTNQTSTEEFRVQLSELYVSDDDSGSTKRTTTAKQQNINSNTN
jgi:hypothetical protein